MNLFARILSHGFALALVALLAIGLIYRGELFPDLQLPDFLSFGSSGGGSEKSAEVQPSPQQETAQPAGEMAAVGGAGSAPAETAAAQSGEAAGEVEAFAPVAADVTSPAAGLEQAAGENADETVAPPAPAEMEAETEPAMPAAAHDMATTGMETTGTAGSEPETAPAAEAEPAPAVVPDTSGAAEGGMPPAAGTGQEEVTPDMATGVSSEHPVSSRDDAAAAPVAAETVQADAAAGGGDAASADTTGQQVDAETARDASKTSSYQLLATAREAYWLRDYEQAEQQYRALIAMDPENPDGYGELGNMYFSQGEWEKAATAYYDAGVRLVDQGLTDHAMQLVEVIRGLDGSQASQLEAIIRESSAPAAN